jgi:hypothetical protein
MVYRQFRSVGMPRPPLREVAHAWGWVIRGAPRAAVNPEFRVAWLTAAAKRVGRVLGSLEQRVIYL